MPDEPPGGYQWLPVALYKLSSTGSMAQVFGVSGKSQKNNLKLGHKIVLHGEGMKVDVMYGQDSFRCAAEKINKE
jgi:hypothetical protein